jgi:hypothetical protein
VTSPQPDNVRGTPAGPFCLMELRIPGVPSRHLRFELCLPRLPSEAGHRTFRLVQLGWPRTVTPDLCVIPVTILPRVVYSGISLEDVLSSDSSRFVALAHSVRNQGGSKLICKSCHNHNRSRRQQILGVLTLNASGPRSIATPAWRHTYISTYRVRRRRFG